MVEQGLPERHTFNIGDFVEELLVTDTRVYVVTFVTESGDSILLSVAPDGDRTWKDAKRTTPQGYGVVWTEVVEPKAGAEEMRRLRRKDGTFRMGRNTSPLRPCRTYIPLNETAPVPVRETDYRF